jgi:4-carboxymuconolactone decarboxylase
VVKCAISAKHRGNGREKVTSETPTFGRYAEIPYDQMTLEQKDAYDTIIKARGRLPGPVKIWIHNPKLAKVVSAFGVHFQPGGYSLTEREREIAVCAITSHFHHCTDGVSLFPDPT